MRLTQEQSFKLYTLLIRDESHFAEDGMTLKEITRHCSEKLGLSFSDEQVKKGFRSAGLAYDPPGLVRGKRAPVDRTAERLDAIEGWLRKIDSRMMELSLLLHLEEKMSSVQGAGENVWKTRTAKVFLGLKSEGSDGQEASQEAGEDTPVEGGEDTSVEDASEGPVGGDSSVGPHNDREEAQAAGAHTDRLR